MVQALTWIGVTLVSVICVIAVSATTVNAMPNKELNFYNERGMFDEN